MEHFDRAHQLRHPRGGAALHRPQGRGRPHRRPPRERHGGAERRGESAGERRCTARRDTRRGRGGGQSPRRASRRDTAAAGECARQRAARGAGGAGAPCPAAGERPAAAAARAARRGERRSLRGDRLRGGGAARRPRARRGEGAALRALYRPAREGDPAHRRRQDAYGGGRRRHGRDPFRAESPGGDPQPHRGRRAQSGSRARAAGYRRERGAAGRLRLQARGHRL